MKICHFLTSILLLASLSPASPVVVAASIPDLASIAAAVGGSRVEAVAIARGDANPHSVEVLPSHMAKVARARVYLKVGLGLDGWADAIVRGSRNRNLDLVDASHGVEVLEKPEGKVDASMGDVHPEGNPHYWLDPANGLVVARNVAEALSKVDPAGASDYQAGVARFEQELRAHQSAWAAKMAPRKGEAIYTYHSSWSYFAKAFGLRIVGKVEPVPGIPPNARHLAALVETARKEKVRLLLQEPYFPKDGGEFLHRQAGVTVLRLAPECKGVGPNDYLAHLDELVEAVAKGGD